MRAQAIIVSACQQRQYAKHGNVKRLTILELARTGCRKTMYDNILHITRKHAITMMNIISRINREAFQKQTGTLGIKTIMYVSSNNTKSRKKNDNTLYVAKPVREAYFSQERRRQ